MNPTDPATPPAAIATPTNTAASVATTTPTSDGGASSAVVLKPGMTTSEFIVTILIIAIGSTLASGLLVNNTALQIAGVAMATLKAVAYTWSRTQVKTVMMLGCVLFFAHTQAACAGSQRTTAINATDTMTDVAGVALRAYSHDHVESIIHRPGITAAAAQLEINAWYAKVDKAEKDITAIRGLIKNARDAPSVAALEAKATEVLAELKSLETP